MFGASTRRSPRFKHDAWLSQSGFRSQVERSVLSRNCRKSTAENCGRGCRRSAQRVYGLIMACAWGTVGEHAIQTFFPVICVVIGRFARSHKQRRVLLSRDRRSTAAGCLVHTAGVWKASGAGRKLGRPRRSSVGFPGALPLTHWKDPHGQPQKPRGGHAGLPEPASHGLQVVGRALAHSSDSQSAI